jgi:bacteriocin-like protein
MNTQINLLSDNELDAVSGGMIHVLSEGQPPVPGSIRADGSAGSVSTGNSSIGAILVPSTLAGVLSLIGALAAA